MDCSKIGVCVFNSQTQAQHTHTHTHVPVFMPASHSVFLSHTPSSLCTFLFRGNGRFPRVIITCQVPSPPFTNTQTNAHRYTPHLHPPISSPLSQHLPHTLAISLSPKAPAQPHLMVPKWAASALALPRPSGALDSCVSVCVRLRVCVCEHWPSSLRTQPAL